MPSKPIIPVIYGPTAVGKTTAAIELAKRLNGEIISADSRQFYSELNIGTAKPSANELNSARHHFVGNISISDTYTAGLFEKEAERKILDLLAVKKLPIVVGGSGLYIKALMEGLDELPSSPEKRTELNDFYLKEGLEALQSKLKSLDSSYYETVDKNNHIRLIRAIEIIELSGKTLSSQKEKTNSNKPFEPLYIALDRPREELYERINKRVIQMIDQGLLQEVQSLLPYKGFQALQTVGYKELFDYLEEKRGLEEAIELIQRNTRRYAKRQLTWLRSLNDVKIFHPSELQLMEAYIDSKK